MSRAVVRRMRCLAGRVALGAVLATFPCESGMAQAPNEDAQSASTNAESGLTIQVPMMGPELNQAAKLIEERQYAAAVPAIQRLLDEGSRELTAVDMFTVIPVWRVAETMLARLPAEGLAAYRAVADPQARGALEAADSRDLSALLGLVRRFFYTSFGDDIAYRACGLAMDQGHFAFAREMLSRILSEHPDPSVPRARLLAATAAAAARAGQMDEADRALKALAALPEAESASDTVKAVTADARRVLALGPPPPARIVTSYAGPNGLDPEPADPLERAARDPGQRLYELWAHDMGLLGIALKLDPSGNRAALMFPWLFYRSMGYGRHLDAIGPLLLRDGSRVLIDGYDAMVCREARTGLVRWKVENGIAERTRAVPLRMYTLNILKEGQVLRHLRGCAWSLWGDTLYHVSEDPQTYAKMVEELRASERPDSNKESSEIRLPGLGDTLTAVAADTGAARWTTKIETEPGKPAMRLLSAPTRSGGRLLTAGLVRLDHYVVALDAETGRVLWKQPVGTLFTKAGLTVAAAVATDGNDVVVPMGVGLVVAVNAVDGALKWMTEASSPEPQTVVQNVRVGGLRARVKIEVPAPGETPAKGPPPKEGEKGWKPDWQWLWRTWGRRSPEQWRECAVRMEPGQVMVLPATTGRLSAYARDGAPVWIRQLDDLRYCLGRVSTNDLVFAGTGGILRYDVSAGEAVWRTDLKYTGRGYVGRGLVHVPCGSRIVSLDVETGDVVAQIPVPLTGGQPLGDLYPLAQDLLAVSSLQATHVLGYKDIDLRKDSAAGAAPADGAAALARGAVELRLERYREAVASAREALRGLAGGPQREEARRLLVESLAGLEGAGDGSGLDEALSEVKTMADAADLRARVQLLYAERLAARKAWAEAVPLLMAAVESDSDPVLPETTNGLRVAVSVRAGEVLRAALAEGGPSAEGAMDAYARKRMEEIAAGGGHAAAMARLSLAAPETAVGLLVASNAVAVFERTPDRAGAEHLLLQWTHSRRPAIAVEAWRQLAALYERRGWPKAAGAARDGMALVTNLPPIGAVGAGDRVWRRLATEDLWPPRLPAWPWREAWSRKDSDSASLNILRPLPSDLTDARVICLSGARRRAHDGIAFLDAADGSVLSSGRLPSPYRVTIQDDPRLMWPKWFIPPKWVRQICVGDNRLAWLEGQALVVPTAGGPAAYDASSGRRLWTVQTVAATNRTEDAWTVSPGAPRALTAGSGAVAELRADPSGACDVLTVRDALTGRLRWEQKVPDSERDRYESPWLQIVGDLVCMLERASPDRFSVWDLHSGRSLGRRLIGRGSALNWIVTESLLVRPVGWQTNDVAILKGVRIDDGGTAWTTELEGAPWGPYWADTGRMLVSLTKGVSAPGPSDAPKPTSVALIDLAAGKPLWNVSLPFNTDGRFSLSPAVLEAGGSEFLFVASSWGKMDMRIYRLRASDGAVLQDTPIAATAERTRHFPDWIRYGMTEDCLLFPALVGEQMPGVRFNVGAVGIRDGALRGETPAGDGGGRRYMWGDMALHMAGPYAVAITPGRITAFTGEGAKR